MASSSRYRFDVLARAVEGVQERTVCGAVVTVLSLFLIGLLVLYEVKAFVTTTTVHHIGVDDGDTPFGSSLWALPDQIPVLLSMSFAHVECDLLSLEIDATRGDVEPVNAVSFRRPTPHELQGWADDADPETACTLDGQLTVGKVSANFHVEVADAQQQQGNPVVAGRGAFSLQAYAAQMLNVERRKLVNVSHRVHSLHFGERVLADTVAPLDGTVTAPKVAGQQHYLMKVIPTLVDRPGWAVAHTNQYSLAEQFVPYDALAFGARGGSGGSALGVFFYYDFFPVVIQVVQRRPSLSQFLVSICAIVGGVFAFSSIVDGIIFQSAKVLSTKRD